MESKAGWLGPLGPAQARVLSYLLLLGLVGLVFMTFSDLFGAGSRRRPAPATAVAAPPPAAEGLVAHQQSLARELEAALSQVEGAGAVRVTVTLSAGPARVVAVDAKKDSRTVTERDASGGSRTTAEVNETGTLVVLRSGSLGDSPVVLKEQRPEVAGVLVVAAGAGDARVRERLARAAATALGVPLGRIDVVPKAGGQG